MYIKHLTIPVMESDPWGGMWDSEVPNMLASEPLGLPLEGALYLRNWSQMGPQTRPWAASPDFLHCPRLSRWERLLNLASLHSQGTQLLRNSQLLPSPTLSFQTKPVKTGLQWRLWPHLAAARVHGAPASSNPRHAPSRCRGSLDGHWLWDTPRRAARELAESMFFFGLHLTQMELSICAVACPFIAGTGSHVGRRALTERLSDHLPGLLGLLNLCFCPLETWRLCGPSHSFSWPFALSALYLNLPRLFFQFSCHLTAVSLTQVPTSCLHYFSSLLLWSLLHCFHPSEPCCWKTYLSKVYSFGDKVSLLRTLPGSADLVMMLWHLLLALRPRLIEALWPRGSPKAWTHRT